MQKLFDTYHSYNPSERCWLDGKYFDAVFEEYEGFVSEPITIEIGPKRNSTMGPKNVNLFHGMIGLIRVKIRIEESDGKVIRHSNLVVVDPDRKEVLRFEPMLEHKYHDVINAELKKYARKVLPGYTFVEIENHPQKYDKTCEDKGMCVAYVIKAGLMFVMGVADQPSSVDVSTEESLDDIKRFASAIEDLF